MNFHFPHLFLLLTITINISPLAGKSIPSLLWNLAIGARDTVKKVDDVISKVKESPIVVAIQEKRDAIKSDKKLLEEEMKRELKRRRLSTFKWSLAISCVSFAAVGLLVGFFETNGTVHFKKPKKNSPLGNFNYRPTETSINFRSTIISCLLLLAISLFVTIALFIHQKKKNYQDPSRSTSIFNIK